MAAKTITSSAASASMKFRLLEQFAKKSMTSEEAGEAAGLLHTGYWKRVSDLARHHIITPRFTASGKPMLRITSSGRKAQVWQITDAGREELRWLKADMKAKAKAQKAA
jgi:hypothetical protein